MWRPALSLAQDALSLDKDLLTSLALYIVKVRLSWTRGGRDSWVHQVDVFYSSTSGILSGSGVGLVLWWCHHVFPQQPALRRAEVQAF